MEKNPDHKRSSLNSLVDPPGTPPQLIVVKVIFGETLRRLRLYYTELTQESLPRKLRALLEIDASRNFKLERYSDSAKSFLDLTNDDGTLYKQLQRAAKAKGKIRLRLTYEKSDPEPKKAASTETKLPYRPAADATKIADGINRYVQQLQAEAVSRGVQAQHQQSMASTQTESVANARAAAVQRAQQIQENAKQKMEHMLELTQKYKDESNRLLSTHLLPVSYNNCTKAAPVKRDMSEASKKMSIPNALAGPPPVTPSTSHSVVPPPPYHAVDIQQAQQQMAQINHAYNVQMQAQHREYQEFVRQQLQKPNHNSQVQSIGSPHAGDAQGQTQLSTPSKPSEQKIKLDRTMTIRNELARRAEMPQLAAPKSTPNFAPAVRHGAMRELPKYTTLPEIVQPSACAAASEPHITQLPSQARPHPYAMLSAPYLSTPRTSQNPFKDPAESANSKVDGSSRLGSTRQADLRHRLFCDRCNVTITGEHYHCSQCSQDDFDLCMACHGKQAHCFDATHWLIRRKLENGKVVMPVSDIYHPSSKSKPTVPPDSEKQAVESFMLDKTPYTAALARLAKRTSTVADAKESSAGIDEKINQLPGAWKNPAVTASDSQRGEMTECNNCLQSSYHRYFVDCVDCPKFKLCSICLIRGDHGHHPGHSFRSTTKDLHDAASHGLKRHSAICDKCDHQIHGVRHKCLDCPDFDLCNTCIKSAPIDHMGHRFAPIYKDLSPRESQVKHDGVFCDGPGCAAISPARYIEGVRYKCAVCHDCDFCENCESSPSNLHNKSHPLIKFKEPVKFASITTFDEFEGGRHELGDRLPPQPEILTRETFSGDPKPEAKTEVMGPHRSALLAAIKKRHEQQSEHDAVFLYDSIADGTRFESGQKFTQSWVVQNPGPTTWPAGCYIEYTGGEGRLMMPQPYLDQTATQIRDILRGKPIERSVKPGEEVEFSIDLEASTISGKRISYWRVCEPSGKRFGHKLWCDITVNGPKVTSGSFSQKFMTPTRPTTLADSSSELMFPKLEKDTSPSSSTLTEMKPVTTAHIPNQVDDKMFDIFQYQDTAAKLRLAKARSLKASMQAEKAVQQKGAAIRPLHCLEERLDAIAERHAKPVAQTKDEPKAESQARDTVIRSLQTLQERLNVIAESYAKPVTETKDEPKAETQAKQIKIEEIVEKEAEPEAKMVEIDLKDDKKAAEAKEDSLLGSDLEYETIGDGIESDGDEFGWDTDDEYEILESSQEKASDKSS